MIKDCYVGVKGIIRVSGKCLVLKKSTRDLAYWDVPGGRIDDNETLYETLTRELHEELPTIKKFSVGEIAGAYRLDKDIEGDKGLVLIFYTVEAEPFEVVLSTEHIDYKWVTKETSKDLLNTEVSIKPELYTLIERILGK